MGVCDIVQYHVWTAKRSKFPLPLASTNETNLKMTAFQYITTE